MGCAILEAVMRISVAVGLLAACGGQADPSGTQSQSTEGEVLYCSASVGQVTASQAASLRDVSKCPLPGALCSTGGPEPTGHYRCFFTSPGGSGAGGSGGSVNVGALLEAGPASD
jgi:hypothetical protein